MSKSVTSRKITHFLALATLIGGVAVMLDACKQKAPEAPAPVAVAPAAAPAAAARTKEHAMAALMNLPELKAWSERLDKESMGKLRGALIEYSQEAKVIDGKRYWQFSFVENGGAAAHRWESFLVSQTDSEILIDDDDSGKPMTLEQWRRERHPMDRKPADVIGG